MKKIIIQKNNIGQRIDKFLKQEVFLNMGTTRGEIIRNIKAGNILVYPHTKITSKNRKNISSKKNNRGNFGVGVNNNQIKPSYILKENDEIEINLKEKRNGLTPNKNIKFEIVYQNENFIVINKPAGLQVHPSSKNEENTLVSGLVYRFPEIKNVGDDLENRPGIVHRLDKDTSGIMLIARNQKTFEELKNKFKNREIKKAYWALVYGKLKNKSGVIEKPMARAGSYKKQVIAGAKTRTKIRPAITEYKVLKEFDDYSLVEVRPKTGRMHQIRVHLTSIGHPVTGDDKYRLKNIKPNKNIIHQMLHAKNIKFELNGKEYKFEAELSDDFKTFLDYTAIKV